MRKILLGLTFAISLSAYASEGSKYEGNCAIDLRIYAGMGDEEARNFCEEVEYDAATVDCVMEAHLSAGMGPGEAKTFCLGLLEPELELL